MRGQGNRIVFVDIDIIKNGGRNDCRDCDSGSGAERASLSTTRRGREGQHWFLGMRGKKSQKAAVWSKKHAYQLLGPVVHGVEERTVTTHGTLESLEIG